MCYCNVFQLLGSLDCGYLKMNQNLRWNWIVWIYNMYTYIYKYIT